MSARKPNRKKSAIEEGDNPKRSIPLNYDLSCSSEFKPLIEHLAKRLALSSPTLMRPSSLAKTEEAFDLLLANLFNAYRIQPQCFVGVSLSRNDFSSNRYRNRSFGYANFKRAFDYLIDAQPPLITYWNHFSDPRSKKGRTSRVKATGYLRSLIARYKLVLAGTNSNPTNLDLIFSRLVDWPAANQIAIPDSWVTIASPVEVIRLKDSNGCLIDYNNTPNIVSMRKRTETWNDFVRLYHHVDLLKTDTEIKNLFFHGELDEEDNAAASFGDEQDRPEYVQFERFSLHRVFNNSSFEDGGRFYGAWWQRIPSEARRYITINDKPTKEFDYSNLHAAMLYAMEGLPLAEDAYSLPGVPRKYRKLIKATFFRLINAKPGQRIQKPREKLMPPNYKWGDLQSAIKEKHAPIAKHLHSGIGLSLQKTDSNIAEDVMQAMMQRDYLALPIHDSFIVYSGLGTLILEQMRIAYRKHMNADVGIDPDLSFLEYELARSPPDEGDDVPTPLEEIEWRSEEAGYEGYRTRRNVFFAARDEAWNWRFGPGRSF